MATTPFSLSGDDADKFQLDEDSLSNDKKSHLSNAKCQYTKDDFCKLGSYKQCTNKHIIIEMPSTKKP